LEELVRRGGLKNWKIWVDGLKELESHKVLRLESVVTSLLFIIELLQDLRNLYIHFFKIKIESLKVVLKFK